MAKSCMLIIAEKPDAAERIAKALASDFAKRTKFGVPYYEFERDGKMVLVVPASGHLYTVTSEKGGRGHYPVFTFKWAPKYLVEKGTQRTEKIINLFMELSRQADELVNAADYDIEGSLIGYMILKHACGGRENDARRMKFSTLTKEELNRAYENLMPRLDFGLAEAGRARHEVDWLYGVNLSRALTISAAKRSGRYATLSVGRVQGPTLYSIFQREAEIRSFVPKPFWEIYASVEIEGEEYRLEFERDRIDRKTDAEEVANKCSGKTGKVASVEEREMQRNPPEPFDVGSLQREAYRFFGYTPRRTLNIAERLYLDALISYPRTSSQKLPPTIDYRGILQGLSKNPKYGAQANLLLAEVTLKPHEGKKEDSAHPAVYPTGNLPEIELPSDGLRIYDLVAKRFMSTFGRPSVRLNTKVSIECEGYSFSLRGGRILDEGWTAFYHPYAVTEETIIHALNVGQDVLLKKVEALSRFTEPPPRYNPASLLKVMEENAVGTKATRADIIDTLYGRGYIREERMRVTDLGFSVVENLSRYCSEIISVQLTRSLEERMEKIEADLDSREAVLADAINELKPIIDEIKQRELEVGASLSEAIKVEASRKRIVGPCPKCSTGKLVILRSRKTLKKFIGCTNFFNGKCRMALPLPQRSAVITTEKTCKTCGWPVIGIRPPKRRVFHVCINPECPSKNRQVAR